MTGFLLVSNRQLACKRNDKVCANCEIQEGKCEHGEIMCEFGEIIVQTRLISVQFGEIIA